jgi:pimeloyl-ACP methyl ester carboxylesterase
MVFRSGAPSAWLTLLAVSSSTLLLTACTSEADRSAAEEEPSPATVGADSSVPDGEQSGTGSPSASEGNVDGLVDVGDGRRIYVRCTGTGSPTVVLEGGDEDTSDSYAYAETALAEVTRTCVYDRANLGRSDPDVRRRGLTELVADLEATLHGAEAPGPYVLVGTSGGGYITAGYAFAHPDHVSGMVFVEVPAPFRNPPAPIVQGTRWNSPVNVESRDYLQVEKDAWAARRLVGDIPVTVISNQYTPEEIAESPFPSERRLMRTNVREQRGWLVLSPRAEQRVVHTGHAVEVTDPQLVIDAILDVVDAART